MPKAKTNLSYDKTRGTIVAPAGSVEEKWLKALAEIRRLRSAMREAITTINEGDGELAASILEGGLNPPIPPGLDILSLPLSEDQIAALCGGKNAQKRLRR